MFWVRNNLHSPHNFTFENAFSCFTLFSYPYGYASHQKRFSVTKPTGYSISIGIEYVILIRLRFVHSIVCVLQNERCSNIHIDCFTIVMLRSFLLYLVFFVSFVRNIILYFQTEIHNRAKRGVSKRQGSLLNELLKIFSIQNENNREHQLGVDIFQRVVLSEKTRAVDKIWAEENKEKMKCLVVRVCVRIYAYMDSTRDKKTAKWLEMQKRTTLRLKLHFFFTLYR